MTVVQGDGLPVQPVEIDEFQMGPAETYDVIIEPKADAAYTFFAESIDRSGYARATLAPRAGMEAEVPPLRERPLLTMRDMGMAHHDHGGNLAGAEAEPAMDHAAMGHSMDHSKMDHASMGYDMDHSTMDHAAMGHSMNHAEMDHSSMGHSMADMEVNPASPQRHDHPRGPGVINVAQQPAYRMNEAGIGLEHVPHRTLTYEDLKSALPNGDQRDHEREMEIHLTSNMERYMWSFDGVKFSEVDAPIQFRYGERLRVTLVNDTMMPHPIHLHGMFFQLVNGQSTHKPNKHTVIVKPGEKLSFDVTADAVGDWAFHCHLLYHMHAGMMQVVSVTETADVPA